MKQIKIKIDDELNDSYPDGTYLKINGAFYFYEHYLDMSPDEKENELIFTMLFQQFRAIGNPHYVTTLYDLEIGSYCVKRFIDFGCAAHCKDTEDGRIALFVYKPGIGTTEGRSV